MDGCTGPILLTALIAVGVVVSAHVGGIWPMTRRWRGVKHHLEEIEHAQALVAEEQWWLQRELQVRELQVEELEETVRELTVRNRLGYDQDAFTTTWLEIDD